jgi:hypothetical protein
MQQLQTSKILNYLEHYYFINKTLALKINNPKVKNQFFIMIFHRI